MAALTERKQKRKQKRKHLWPVGINDYAALVFSAALYMGAVHGLLAARRFHQYLTRKGGG
ncbi:MAG: hypothetical protein AAFN38_08415 [Cyanobacteria bacterium J06560_5]